MAFQCPVGVHLGRVDRCVRREGVSVGHAVCDLSGIYVDMFRDASAN